MICHKMQATYPLVCETEHPLKTSTLVQRTRQAIMPANRGGNCDSKWLAFAVCTCSLDIGMGSLGDMAKAMIWLIQLPCPIQDQEESHQT